MKPVLGICKVVVAAVAAVAVVSMVPADEARLLDDSALAGLRGGQLPPPVEFCAQNALYQNCRCLAVWCSQIQCTPAWYYDGENDPKPAYASGMDPLGSNTNAVKDCFWDPNCEFYCVPLGTWRETGCKLNVWFDDPFCGPPADVSYVPLIQLDCVGW